MTKLTQTEKELLELIDDPYIQELYYYICIGDVAELTPLSCENLMKNYIAKQNQGKGK